MVKDLEGKMDEEQLRSLGLLGPDQRRLRAALTVAAAPQGEWRAVLSSVLLGKEPGPREWPAAAPGDSWGGGQRKGLPQKAAGMEQLSREVIMAPSCWSSRSI